MPRRAANTAMGTRRLRSPRITLSTVRRKISHAQGTVLEAERFLKAHEGSRGILPFSQKVRQLRQAQWRRHDGHARSSSLIKNRFARSDSRHQRQKFAITKARTNLSVLVMRVHLNEEYVIVGKDRMPIAGLGHR